MTGFFLQPEVDGYRDADRPLALPDLRLTADEFLHWHAVGQEVIQGAEIAHKPVSGIVPSNYLRGFPKPGCPACDSIMQKAAALLREAERVGMASWL